MPKLSLVTPSFNQVKFVKSTLSNVVSTPSFPPFEHLIYDPGCNGRHAGYLEAIRAGARLRRTPCRGRQGRNPRHQSRLCAEHGEGGSSWRGSTPTTAICHRTCSSACSGCSRNNPMSMSSTAREGHFVDPGGVVLRDVFINTDPALLKRKFFNSVGILQPALFMRRGVFDAIGRTQRSAALLLRL